MRKNSQEGRGTPVTSRGGSSRWGALCAKPANRRVPAMFEEGKALWWLRRTEVGQVCKR